MLHRLISDVYNRTDKSSDLYKFLCKSQYFDRETLKELQFQKLKKIIQWALSNSVYINDELIKRKSTVKTINSLEDVQLLPIMEKSDLRRMIDHLNLKEKKENILYRSGGSTGEPISIYATKNHRDWLRAAVLRSYDWIGYRSGERRARLFAAPTKNGIAENTVENRIHYWLSNNRFFDVSTLNEENILSIIASLKLWKPKFITGYTSSLTLIANMLIDNKTTLNIPNLKIVNAAEHLSPEQRILIESGFGGDMYDHYGTREIGYIAEECEEKSGLHINMEYLFIEIVNKNGEWVNEGEEGEVLITELENYCMPIIRYRIGDLAIRTNAYCKCGRGLEMTPTIIGRNIDCIHLSNGNRVNGIMFPHIMKDFPIIEYQIIQNEIGKVAVFIVPSTKTITDFDKLNSALTNILPNTEINLHIVSNISRLPNGKLRTVISNI